MSYRAEVLVVGGGPGGVPAAIAAARQGARVILVERYGFLGGMATAGLVNPFMVYWAGEYGKYEPAKQLSRGIFEEIIQKLSSLSGLAKDRQTFDPEAMKFALQEMVHEAGVEVLLHTLVTGADVEDNTITKVYGENKSGQCEFRAEIFIDSTGDCDLAARAGAPFEVGREKDGLTQPMTLNFRVGGVDKSRIPTRDEINRLYKEDKRAGKIDNPREDVLFFNTLQDDILHFNTTRVVRRDATNGEDLSRAEFEARRQVWQVVEFLRSKVPGFERAYLLLTATQIGVRETRRIQGPYVLTEKDVLSARKFEDGIARGAYDIDIHNPAGTGTVIKRLKPGTYYEIPYRCIYPERPSNLLIGSRCISATHEAHSSLRVMPIVASIGEAAGTAAGICIKEKKQPKDLDGKMLKRILLFGDAT